MSRIGKKPVPVPAAVTASVNGREVKVKGAKGELAFTVPELIEVENTAAGIAVKPVDDSKQARSMWGMSRTMIANMIKGVTDGYSHNLEIHGVGFRAAMKGKDLEIQVGFSHPVLVNAPEGIQFEAPNPTQLIVRGADKERVGQVAADLRRLRKPDPYQQKGVRYTGEVLKKKAGKTGAK